MSIINSTIKNILPLDEVAMEKAQRRQNSLLKPKNSLGLLEKLTVQLSGIYRSEKLNMPQKAILIFGADNGVYEEKVSKDKQSLTKWHFPNLSQNYSAIGSICQHTNTKIFSIDLGIKGDYIDVDKESLILSEKISYGTENMTSNMSMTVENAQKSIEIGIRYTDNAIKSGYNMIFIGEMGIANTTPATAIVSVITGKNPAEITGRGSGIDDEYLKNKINAIQTAIEKNKVNRYDYMDIISKIGGYETGAMLGVILSCCANHIPVILDGLITYSAAMLANLISPITKDYMIPSHITREKAGSYALDYLGFTPPLDADICLGEGYGGVLYSQIIESAIFSYNTMAVFDEIIVKNGEI